ncbi:MAG TPA: hypothetical protein VGL81_27690 [Polyangiaceae bacterium]
MTRAIMGGALAASWALGMVLARPAAAQAPPPQPQATDKVAAEALFEDGRRLVAAGSFAEACPKFADSERLDPSAGTLLNLASCYEKLGRTATAWATYREAASAASATGRTEYLATAQRHADALAPTLSRLTLTVAQPVEGLQVTRDGVRVERAEWGTPIPVDPGSHSLAATAPGHKSWASGVDVPKDGLQVSVSVPALEAAPPGEPPAPAVVPPPLPAPLPSPPAPAVPERAQGGGSGQRILGLVVAGVGVVGLGVGAGFAVSAKSQYNTSLGNCESGNPNLCNGTGVSQRNDARSAGNVASVAVSVGAAALVGGAVIWLTAPRAGQPPSSSARIGLAPTLGGAVVEGAW